MTSVDLRHLRYFAAVTGVRTSRELPQTAREKFVGSFAVRVFAPAPCQSRFCFRYRKSMKSP
jgi:hypothetical protein